MCFNDEGVPVVDDIIPKSIQFREVYTDVCHSK